ncbi:MurR/RpiR family transcriptional regulator [Atopococcus tabaci]|uniref:MurR/RpiR family transcriptional regulator n=1 Tax=Atopococcus tabaci TaxID=269774 RepID=UPI00041EB54F|nr:MurR/RpiR family transcriptional regulator [Atopococcus tabaci]
MQELSFANRVTQNLELLSKKEKHIAKFLLENKESIKQMGITEISSKTNTSNSTVSRMMNKLGYSSFGDFKALITREDHDDLPLADVVNTISSYYHQVIQSTTELLDIAQCSKFVEAIANASRIIVCGIGNSGLSAFELESRLMRMGLQAEAITDPHMMLMRTSLLDENDMLLALSSTGKTDAILATCRSAKKRKTPIYTITSQNYTELTEIADEILFASDRISVPDEKFINSQLATHYILDILCYLLLKNDTYLNNRRKTLEALEIN